MTIRVTRRLAWDDDVVIPVHTDSRDGDIVDDETMIAMIRSVIWNVDHPYPLNPNHITDVAATRTIRDLLANKATVVGWRVSTFTDGLEEVTDE